MNDFGMPTLIELPEIDDCAKLCKELGLQFIELNMNLPQYQPQMIDVNRLQKTAMQYHIYYTIHLDENFNPCDFNKLVTNAYVQTMVHTIEAAKALDVPILNMHMSDGVYFTMPDRRIYLFEDNEKLYLQKQAEFKDVCEKEIGNSDIRICIENCGGWLGFQIKALEMLLHSNHFNLTFDVGHNAVAEDMAEPFIIQNKDKLCHFHLHDAAGRKDHLALGTGGIDFPKYLQIAEDTNSRIVLETKTVAGLRQSVEWIRQNSIVN